MRWRSDFWVEVEAEPETEPVNRGLDVVSSGVGFRTSSVTPLGAGVTPSLSEAADPPPTLMISRVGLKLLNRFFFGLKIKITNVEWMIQN